MALGWVAAEVVHLPRPLLVIAVAALGAWLGYRFGRDLIRLVVGI